MENIEDLTRRLTRAKRAEFIEREKGANAGMSVEGKVTAGRDLLSLIGGWFSPLFHDSKVGQTDRFGLL